MNDICFTIYKTLNWLLLTVVIATLVITGVLLVSTIHYLFVEVKATTLSGALAIVIAYIYFYFAIMAYYGFKEEFAIISNIKRLNRRIATIKQA